MISILDYGVGNVGSVKNMFKKLGHESNVIDSNEQILNASKILLPGVGHYDKALEKLEGYRKALDQRVLKDEIPILGICLGMQLLTDGSEEGELPGLGYISGFTRKFNFRESEINLRIPHMGWNYVKRAKQDSALLKNIEVKDKFYFVHSYFVSTNDANHTILNCDYGIRFSAAISRDNIYGTQFHPEKSHKYGMKILDNYAKI